METKLQNIKKAEERDNANKRIEEQNQETVDETKDKKENETNALEKKNLRKKRGKRKLNYCYRPEKTYFEILV